MSRITSYPFRPGISINIVLSYCHYFLTFQQALVSNWKKILLIYHYDYILYYQLPCWIKLLVEFWKKNITLYRAENFLILKTHCLSTWKYSLSSINKMHLERFSSLKYKKSIFSLYLTIWTSHFFMALFIWEKVFKFMVE